MLSAAGITFGYKKASDPILDGWSADFAAGEVVAITGPSGKGKSTLLYLLGLMVQPLSGSLSLDGEDLLGLTDRRRAAVRAREYGFVFQDASLDATRTVIDNVVETALYRGQDRGEAKERAIELMIQFDVNLRATARPGQISGGQAQRIALCRALLGNPRILLADEPTGNLDPTSADVVVNAFRAHARSGASVIIVTHDPRVVRRCDRQIQL